MMSAPKTPYELFAVECGEGWKHLYQPLLDLAGLYGATVLQVKEKFGGLRFYFAGGSNYDGLQMLVDAAEMKSYHVCEDCGEDGWEWDPTIPKTDPRYGESRSKARLRKGGWLRTLCDPCAEKCGYVQEEVETPPC
jgi:hypothetical protein